jgi:signal transduction histidine kinase
VGVPISVEGRLWGLVVALSTREEPMPDDTETRLGSFTELVSTAIADAEARAALTASRARIVVTADETRRRFERDLHDGAQQRFVAAALRVRGAQAAVPPDLPELVTELDQVAEELTGAIDELRDFAQGIHPAILSEGGLQPALRKLARRSAVPVDLDVRTNGRLPERVEVAAYYVVSEALTNAAKHGHASSATVRVEAGSDRLRVAVSDDGVGGARFGRGSGLVGLKDRVEALGGGIALQSEPAAGTTLSVELPLADDAEPDIV